MKVLVYEWNGYCQKDLRDALNRMGIQAERIGYVVREQCGDAFLEEKLAQRLKKGYDVCMSFNYFPPVAKCCHDAGIPYIAWIYDGEDMGLYHTSVYYDTNFIFSFDSNMVKRMKAKGIDHFWYMPLGVNTPRLDAIPYSKEEEEQYGCDISFIGNLYTNRHAFESIKYSDYIEGYLEGLINAQVRINFSSLLDELVNEDFEEMMKDKYPPMNPRYTLTTRESMRNLMATSVTQRERFVVMEKLSGHYPVDLYTYSQTEKLPNVRVRGVAGYFTSMPRIFRYSKINLNLTHRMIMSGIPLRVMDVLGAGGFLMSNYQSDMEGVLRDGEELVIYYSIEDLIEKVGFYLEHEEERRRIAKNGHDLVSREYQTEKLVAAMFRQAGITL